KIHSLLTGSDIKNANGSYYIRHYLPFTHPMFQDKFDFSTVNLGMALKSDADILVVQRVALSDENIAYKLLEHCQKNGIQTVYETDDHLFGLPLNHADSAQYERALPAAKFFAEHADMIITSSDKLKENLLIYNDNVKVIPNALDERLWQAPGRQSKNKFSQLDSPVRILYMGTYTHLNDLLVVEDAMKKILHKWEGRVAFDVIGITKEQNNLKWINPVKIPSHNYPKFVKWLCGKSCWSIGIAPLEATEFNNCKSFIKYLDYAALGLVPVCSNVSPYQSVVQTGQNGLLVDNNTEAWYTTLNSLIENKDYRAKLAKNAYQNFSDQHTLKTESKNWINAFDELTKTK
ncbi:MAG: glycosyltransferase, partial [Desulfobacteraceae bacterium]|nr:glycosyltransferase [Desulfobacteraceae bacterium]